MPVQVGILYYVNIFKAAAGDGSSEGSNFEGLCNQQYNSCSMVEWSSA